MSNSRILRRVDPFPFVPRDTAIRDKRCEEIFSIQTTGLKRRLTHVAQRLGKDQFPVSIGVSGGLDSALALLVVVRAFDRLGWDRKNILAVTMPGFGTTDRTYRNATSLIKEAKASLREISIKDAVLGHCRDIGHEFHRSGCARCQNIQARERTQILMNLAFTIGTGDLSELALGWCTYNGDHMAMYNPNADIPKTLVRFVVRRTADRDDVPQPLRAVLYDILDTPISPELEERSDATSGMQETEHIIGPYELHDFFLYYMLRFGFSSGKILFLAECANANSPGEGFSHAYTHQEIIRWLIGFYTRFGDNQFKRDAMPNGPKVGSVALSPRGDWRMPSDIELSLWIDQLNSLIGTV